MNQTIIGIHSTDHEIDPVFFFLTIGFFISEWQSFKNCSGCEPPRCVKVDRKMRCVNEGLKYLMIRGKGGRRLLA